MNYFTPLCFVLFCVSSVVSVNDGPGNDEVAKSQGVSKLGQNGLELLENYLKCHLNQVTGGETSPFDLKNFPKEGFICLYHCVIEPENTKSETRAVWKVFSPEEFKNYSDDMKDIEGGYVWTNDKTTPSTDSRPATDTAKVLLNIISTLVAKHGLGYIFKEVGFVYDGSVARTDTLVRQTHIVAGFKGFLESPSLITPQIITAICATIDAIIQAIQKTGTVAAYAKENVETILASPLVQKSIDGLTGLIAKSPELAQKCKQFLADKAKMLPGGQLLGQVGDAVTNYLPTVPGSGAITESTGKLVSGVGNFAGNLKGKWF